MRIKIHCSYLETVTTIEVSTYTTVAVVFGAARKALEAPDPQGGYYCLHHGLDVLDRSRTLGEQGAQDGDEFEIFLMGTSA